MATDEKPFFIQFYRDGACGHQKMSANDNHYDSCLGDYEPTEDGFSAQYVRFYS